MELSRRIQLRKNGFDLIIKDGGVPAGAAGPTMGDVHVPSPGMRRGPRVVLNTRKKPRITPPTALEVLNKDYDPNEARDHGQWTSGGGSSGGSAAGKSTKLLAHKDEIQSARNAGDYGSIVGGTLGSAAGDVVGAPLGILASLAAGSIGSTVGSSLGRGLAERGSYAMSANSFGQGVSRLFSGVPGQRHYDSWGNAGGDSTAKDTSRLLSGVALLGGPSVVRGLINRGKAAAPAAAHAAHALGAAANAGVHNFKHPSFTGLGLRNEGGIHQAHGLGLSVKSRMTKSHGGWELIAKIGSTDDEERVVYGFASVNEKDGNLVTDRQGDQIDTKDLVRAAHKFMKEHRTGGNRHHQMGIGEVVESIVLRPEVQKSLGIDLGKTAWFIGMKITNDSVWQQVKKGELQAFSIGGKGRRKAIAA